MPCMMTGASGGRAPAWLATSSAPPVAGHVLEALPLGAEPAAVDRVEQLAGDRPGPLGPTVGVDVATAGAGRAGAGRRGRRRRWRPPAQGGDGGMARHAGRSAHRGAPGGLGRADGRHRGGSLSRHRPSRRWTRGTPGPRRRWPRWGTTGRRPGPHHGRAPVGQLDELADAVHRAAQGRLEQRDGDLLGLGPCRVEVVAWPASAAARPSRRVSSRA